MASDVEIERTLAAVTATLNDREWITERQNDAAERSDTAIPGKVE